MFSHRGICSNEHSVCLLGELLCGRHSLWASTAQQRPNLQADGVHRYVKRAGLDIVAEHMDMAISGRQEGRAQVQALVGAARHHEFAYVLVRKFDHLNTHAN
jgi:Resolvase, N terminal domain